MSEQGPIETFRDIIKEADAICDLDKRTGFFAKHEEDIKSALDTLKNKEDWLHLGLAQRILTLESLNSAIPLFPLYPSEELCRRLGECEQDISEMLAEFNYERARALKERAGKGVDKYTDRHRLLESSIRMVWELFDSSGVWPYSEGKPASKREACSFIAECYLLRSRVALPKGETVPEKKLEALLKAWQWAEKGYPEVDDMKIEIALERDRWDANLPEEWIKARLESFLGSSHLNFSKPLHWAVNDRVRDLFPDRYCKNNDEKVLQIPTGQQHVKDHFLPFLPLYQARAALRTGSDDMSKWLEKAVAALKLPGGGTGRHHLPFSHPLWEDTVDLLKKTAQEGKYRGQWEGPAINVWRMCKEEESRVKLSIQLRWYWSRYRQLYQLAFQAALNLANGKPGNLSLAAEIADSQKSRPTIKVQAMERFLSEKDANLYKRYVESDILMAAGNFAAGLEELKDISVPEKEKGQDIMNIPNGWAAIHFNIIDRDNAHALIVENGKCQHIPITISPLWDTFNRWSVAGRTPELLKELCCRSGEMLEPVMDKIKAHHLLFVPHSFLHLVPLHASRLKEGNYLFQEKTSLFLPSWSLEMPPKGKANATNGDILLTNWKYYQDIKQLVERDDWTNDKRMENTARDFFDTLENLGKPPHILVLFSHGQGNMVNPYHARFVLKDTPLTHQDIIQKLPESSLAGTKVILTACESDLVSGSLSLIDEHMSLATAFLRRGAYETMGALFECLTKTSSDLILASKENPDESLYTILKKKQNKWLKENSSLSEIAVFRVMGFPPRGKPTDQKGHGRGTDHTC